MAGARTHHLGRHQKMADEALPVPGKGKMTPVPGRGKMAPRQEGEGTTADSPSVKKQEGAGSAASSSFGRKKEGARPLGWAFLCFVRKKAEVRHPGRSQNQRRKGVKLKRGLQLSRERFGIGVVTGSAVLAAAPFP